MMGVKTEYICDHCGHKQEISEQMWEVRVSLNHYNMSTNIERKELWCRECCVAVGFLTNEKPLRFVAILKRVFLGIKYAD